MVLTYKGKKLDLSPHPVVENLSACECQTDHVNEQNEIM